MKKIFTYIAIFAALAAVSCTRSEADFGMKDSSVLSITLNPDEMVTRASEIPGVEGVVSQFDWFFYSDATGTSDPIYHGHAKVEEDGSLSFSGANVPDANEVDENGCYHLGFNIKTNYADLKGSYYVYVLANYDGIDHTATDLKLTTLLAKKMETNWDEKSGTYAKIDDFVMDSYSGDDKATYPQLVPLSAAKAGKYFTDGDEEGILTVGLRRVAAKMTFTLNISEELPDPSGNGTFWRPLTKSDNFVAYVVNAVSYAEVNGKPQDAEDMAPDFITGDNVITGGHQISYATSHIKTATDADEEDEDYTPLVWKLDPFYTYPVEFKTESNNAPYLKIALPWENVDANGNLVNQGATVYYYKVYLLDPDSKKPVTSYDRNKHYIVTVNVNVLGGSPEDYTTLTTEYYVADWQSPAGGTYGGYMAPRYLDVARNEYNLYGDNSTTIAVTSSHPIAARILSVSQKTISGGDKMNTVPSSASVTPNGRESFTLKYDLNTDVGSGDMDLTIITWKVRVYHADDPTPNSPSYYVDVTIYQYPSIYGEQNITASTNSGYLNGVRFSTTQGGNPQNNPVRSNDNNKNLGAFYGGNPQGMDKLVLTVSSLASLADVDGFTGVVIGDPRVRIYPLYDITRQGITWDRNDLGVSPNYIDNYLIADPAKNNVIAPRFMFPSGKIGANSQNGSFSNGGSWRAAAMRCAAYQEDGYPAGRWRLPTEAEVLFVRTLQEKGYISGLFNNGSKYWSSSGSYVLNGVITQVPASDTNTTASVRCVYDLWYWGDTKYDNSGNPTTTAPATQWLGFMTE